MMSPVPRVQPALRGHPFKVLQSPNRRLIVVILLEHMPNFPCLPYSADYLKHKIIIVVSGPLCFHLYIHSGNILQFWNKPYGYPSP